MKIAFTARDSSPESSIDPRFGRAAWLLIHNDKDDSWESFDNTAGRNTAHGAGIQAAQAIADRQADAVVTGAIGPKAFASLQAAGIRIFHGASGRAIDALKAFQDGLLKEANEEDATGGV